MPGLGEWWSSRFRALDLGFQRPDAGWLGPGLGLATALIVLALWAGGLFQTAEFATLDARFALREVLAPAQVSPTDPVVVAIDDRSLAAVGNWPWPGGLQAQLVQKVAAAGATTIALDLPLVDLQDPDAGQKLVGAIANAGDVILPVNIPTAEGHLETPSSALQRAAAALGHTDLTIDPDGIVRRAPAACSSVSCPPGHVTSGWSGFWALGAVLAQHQALTHGRQLSVAHRPIGIDFRLFRDPRDPSQSVLAPQVPAVDVLAGNAGDLLRGRAVIIGVTAPAIKAAQPYETPFRQLDRVPGADIQAALARTILQHSEIQRVDGVWSTLAVALGGLLLGWSAFRLRPGLSIGAGAAAIVGWSGLALLVFVGRGLWLDVVPVWLVLAATSVEGAVFHYERIDRRSRQMEERFARYVAPEVVAQLSAGSGTVELGGERRHLTVLFADLRGFTSFAEESPPEQTLAVLNRHLQAMSEAVLSHGGTLDKFLGDGVMAFFGAPLSTHDHAKRAVEAALAMGAALARLEGPRLPLGVGVATGEAVVGHIGSEKRVDYTAIGDVVNVAARLEELAGPGEIWVSDAVCRAAGSSTAWRYDAVAPTRLKGRREPLVCHRVQPSMETDVS